MGLSSVGCCRNERVLVGMMRNVNNCACEDYRRMEEIGSVVVRPGSHDVKRDFSEALNSVQSIVYFGGVDANQSLPLLVIEASVGRSES